MKIAVLADIHANYHALTAVSAHLEAWQPEAVIVAGDIVNRGPRSLDCLQFVQKKARAAGWILLAGNHEDYVCQMDTDEQFSPQQLDLYRPVRWTHRQLNGDTSAIAGLPFDTTLTTPEGQTVRATHASMRGNRDGIYHDTTPETLRRQIAPAPNVFCVGHTHRPLVRRIDGTTIMNVGAVGLPFDGDTRACYGQLTWNGVCWRADVIRVPYDLSRTRQDFYDTGFIAEGGPIAKIILDELENARSLLYWFAVESESRVLSGELTVEQAVDLFLVAHAL